MIIDEKQQTIIEKKILLNFWEELKNNSLDKKNFSKKFRDNLDVFIPKLYNNGVMFYGFTVVMPMFDKYDKNFWYNLHFSLETLISFFRDFIELIEFSYLSIEFHKESSNLAGIPHFHGVFGVRSFLGENFVHLNEIRQVFNIDNFDIKINRLNSIKDIKAYWNYIMKENNFKFHRFTRYSNFYENLYKNIQKFENNYPAFNLDETLGSKSSFIMGIFDKNPDNVTIITYLVDLYFQVKNFSLNNNNIYEKVKGLKYSWSKKFDLNFLNEKNIQIFKELQLMYPQQLGDLKIFKLFSSGWDKFYEILKKKNHYISRAIEFKDKVVEFKDGLYFIKHHYFYDFSKNSDDLNINCEYYFNISFRNCKQKKPIIWLSSLKNTLQTDNVDDFCINFAKYFHEFRDEKKKTMCVIGDSDTSKSTLVSRVLTKLFGIENIGIVSNTDRFAFEQIEGKKIIICDEFKFSTGNRSDLLKILDDQPILMDKKSEKKRLFLNTIPTIFLFNHKINDKMLKDPGFINRLIIYEFKSKVLNKDDFFLSSLDKELPQILIHCNSLFFEHNNKKFIFRKKTIKNLVIDIKEK